MLVSMLASGTMSLLPTGCTKTRYYKSMTAVETRFPISSEKGNVKLSFPWTDAFRPSKKTSQVRSTIRAECTAFFQSCQLNSTLRT